MHQLLLFEFIHADAEAFVHASAGMRREGRAILEALLTDAVALNDFRITIVLCKPALVTFDNLPAGVELYRCPEVNSPLDVLVAAAHNADFVLPIAPESDGLLLSIAQVLQPLPCITLLPSPSTVEICSDKLQTWNTVHSSSIPMVECCSIHNESAEAGFFDPQSVFKPRWGAGCEGIRRGRLPQVTDPQDYIRQPLVTGRSISVAALCGPCGSHLLPVAEQEIIWEEDMPNYKGGTIPANIPSDAKTRVVAIARHVLRKLGHCSGYLGMDFLLSETDGTVYLNEVNPRVCTSYVGYRQLLTINPLEVLLGTTTGPVLTATPHPVTFRTEGTT